MNKENYNILYVDDEKSSLSAFRNLFRRKFNIFTASSGEEGLELLATQPIHVIITDQRMPNMLGTEFLKNVKATWPDFKYIILTAYNDNEVMKEAINEVGVFWYVNKPFDPDQMEQVITNAENTYLAEKKLKESEEKFRGVFNSISDVFTRSDMEGNCIMVSPSIYKMIGYKPEEILGKNLADFYVNPKQRGEIVNKLQKSRTVENFEIDVVRKDGQKITLSTNAKLYYNDKGEPLGVEGIFRDISSQKAAEDKVKAQKDFLENIIESLPHPFYVIDAMDYTILHANTSAKKLNSGEKSTCYTMTHIRNEPCDPIGCPLTIVKKTKKPAILEHVHFDAVGDKRIFELYGYPIVDSEGEIIQMIEYSIDITDRKKTEEKLRQSEELYRITVEHAKIGIVHVAPDGKFLQINQKFCDITGYNKDELLAIPFKDITHPDDIEIGLTKLGQMLRDEIKYFNYEKRYIRKDGGIVTVILNTQLVRNELGEPKYFVSMAEDITDKKRAESEHDKLFNNSFDLLCIAGFDGYFKEINPSWEKITGYTREELCTKPFIDFIHPDDTENTTTELKGLFEGRATIDFENRYITKSGKEIHLSWTVTPAPEEKQMYCIARDITDRKMAELKIDQYQQRLKGLANELTISEEKIRKQIAVDLHDHVGQLLASMRMQMARITDMEENPELTVRMKSISQGLLKSIQATRAAIFDLSPPQLNEIGLVAATHDWMKEQIEQKHDIKTVISSDSEDFKLEENTRFLLFRSIKELMMNTVKHAKASQLTIALKTIGNMLEITIEDDGSGFNYNPDLLRLKSDSYGLFSIQERMSDLGGIMKVESVMDKGTLIKLTVPLSEKSL